MARRVVKDLFGKPIRQYRPRYKASLEQNERKTRPERAPRVRRLSDTIPNNLMFGTSVETALVFEAATASFVSGNFTAVVVLAAAFVEHWFVASLASRGYQKEASQGLAAAVSLLCGRSPLSSKNFMMALMVFLRDFEAPAAWSFLLPIIPLQFTTVLAPLSPFPSPAAAGFFISSVALDFHRQPQKAIL